MFLLSKAVAQKPIALSWKLEGNLPSNKARHLGLGVAGPVTGITHDVLIVAGGANFPEGLPWKGGKKKYYNVIYVFKKQKNRWIQLKDTVQLPFPVAYTANCSTEKGVVYAGGENESGISNKVFILNWDNTKNLLQSAELPSLPLALTNAAATVVGTTIYVAGGETTQGVSKKIFSLDLLDEKSGWKTLADLPLPVSHTILLPVHPAGNEMLCVVGGRCKQANGVSDLYDRLLVYDIKTGKWSEAKSLPYPLSAGTGVSVSGKGLLIFGGDKGTVFHQVELLNSLLQHPESDADKTKLLEKKNNLLATHPGFSKDILYFDFALNTWSRWGSIPYKTPVTTTAVRSGDYVYIPSGEIRAGVRTPAILSVKLSPYKK